jgi:inner membrane protein
MFIFAHAGITLGGAAIISGAAAGYQRLHRRNVTISSGRQKTPSIPKTTFSEIIGLNSLTRFLDVRLLILGSMFPDIIDKPLSFFGFGDGRSITHTLLVTLIFVLASLYLFLRYRQTWLLAVAFGMCTHLILDSMWVAPETLFWPLFGWIFPSSPYRMSFTQIGIWWHTLITNPAVDISEAVGFLILAGFTSILIYQNQLKSILIKGKVYP